MEARLDKIAKFNCIRISDKIKKLSNYVMIQQYFNNYDVYLTFLLLVLILNGFTNKLKQFHIIRTFWELMG